MTSFKISRKLSRPNTGRKTGGVLEVHKEVGPPDPNPEKPGSGVSELRVGFCS